ncbi:MAG TPA: hypothetical protein VK327_05875 [Candidatus Paceibacterota bacterium]|nr:hypothetical protein [Candidatus Paceibacterota bacterium]
MVSCVRLLLALTLILSGSASPVAARDYRLGETAEEDIGTPVALDVINTDATDALRERESRRVPVIYRFNPRVIDEAEAAFHSMFARTRSNFLSAVQARFEIPILTSDDIDSNDFQRFLTQFQRRNVLFPVGANLARVWARGESDRDIESALTARLHGAMSAYIRSDAAPVDVWVGSTIRLISPAENETPSVRLVEERGFNIAKTNFVSIQRSKADLVDSFPAEEHSTAKFLASFIRPNCAMEADLTHELRTKRTAGLLAADHYNSGQIIVKRGQVVDQKAMAALNRLKEKNAVAELQQLTASSGKPPGTRGLILWIAAGAVAALVFFAALWKAAQRRARAVILPAFPAPMISSASADAPLADESWRQRALAAEQRAEKAQAVVRSGLIGHLAQWMANKMTQKMISQREQLLDTHDRAASEVAELEARLEKVQAPLQERLEAYEHRIADLEQELTVKGEENRELIRAKIQVIRKQLEIERERNRTGFN